MAAGGGGAGGGGGGNARVDLCTPTDVEIPTLSLTQSMQTHAHTLYTCALTEH